MVPAIKEAYSPNWEHGRAGKVASFLCASDPGVFEPEEGHEKHPDIEYYYILHCINHKGGSMNEIPTWVLEIYDPDNLIDSITIRA